MKVKTTNKQKRPVGRSRKSTTPLNKVWYAIGFSDNPDVEGEELYSYKSIESAIEGAVETSDKNMHVFKIELLGRLEIKREIKYNIKQVTNGK